MLATSPGASSRSAPGIGIVRLKQLAAVVLGLLLASAMMLLGWWQLQVYREAGDSATQARIAKPALDLITAAPAGQQPNEAYGRTVRFSGHYQPDSQLLVPDPDEPGTYRVVTAFLQDNGSAVAVVRGVYRGPVDRVPPPPSGQLVQEGVLLASEGTNDSIVDEGQLSSVRISVLAQSWEWPLVSGFVTLDARATASQGLEHRAPELPREGGELRNGAYAVQWWVFAAFAVGMGIKMARDFGREFLATVTDAADSADAPGGTLPDGAHADGARSASDEPASDGEQHT